MTTFKKFLKTHQNDASPIGDIAYDVASDPAFPIDEGPIEQLSYLIQRGADELAKDALVEAWAEFQGTQAREVAHS